MWMEPFVKWVGSSAPWPVIALGRLCRGRICSTVKELRALGHLRRSMNRVRRQGGSLGPSGRLEDRKWLATLERDWYGAAIGRSGPRRGVERAIEEIDALGLRQVVVSDHESDFKLERLGLGHHFDRRYQRRGSRISQTLTRTVSFRGR